MSNKLVEHFTGLIETITENILDVKSVKESLLEAGNGKLLRMFRKKDLWNTCRKSEFAFYVSCAVNEHGKEYVLVKFKDKKTGKYTGGCMRPAVSWEEYFRDVPLFPIPELKLRKRN